MATKSPSSRRGSTGGKRPASKKGGSAASRKRLEAERRAKQQMHAIILFALGILLFLLTVIKGGSFWQTLHNVLFVVFGIGSLFVSITLIYIAILLTAGKPVKARALLCSLTILCLCGALQIFQMGLPSGSDVFLDQLVTSAIAGMSAQSGGFIGALIGIPLLRLFDKLGAGIIIVLLLVVLVMLLSGATLIGVAYAARKPIKTIGNAYAEQVVKQEERAEQRAQKQEGRKTAANHKMQSIDIPLDGEARAKAPPTPQKESVPDEQEAKNEKKEAEAASQKKFDIDVSLDDNFKPSEAGGFALGLAEDEDIKKASAQPDELDALVKKAVSEGYPPPTLPPLPVPQRGTASQPAVQEAAASAPIAPPETAKAMPPWDDDAHLKEKLGFRLNLPPDIDEVDGLADSPAPADDPFFAHRQEQKPVARAPEPPPRNTEPIPQEERGEPDQAIQRELAGEVQAPAAPPVYRKPPFTLLRPSPGQSAVNMDEMKANAQLLVDTLASFGVQTRIVDISRGPAVTRYELQPSAGVKISKITGLSDDIALNLAAAGVRIEAPIPNKAAVGIEVPNKVVSTVSLREIVDSQEFRDAKSNLAVALGRDIAGNITLADIGKMPHLLIAGSTGSGKSVCINSIIMSLLFRAKPDEVRFLMIDPKVVELGVYNGIPHLLVPVVTDPKKAAGALSWAVTEMLKRYKLFADNSVRDLNGYNNLAARTEGMEPMPQVVIIIDELADLMMAAPNEIEDYICRLAQMARAAGMHLIIATQRPSVDVITGVIKANIPSRIAFAVSSQIDSRTILDMGGAEKLLGRGDMLFNPIGSAKPIRVQGCFVTDEEIESVISFIKNDAAADYDQQIVEEIDSHVVAGKGSKGGSSGASSEASGGDTEDEMLMPAIECVVEAGQASTSLLQRRLKLGYARAARIVDEMEARGIVGPFEGSKPRQVLLTPERLAELKLSQQK